MMPSGIPIALARTTSWIVPTIAFAIPAPRAPIGSMKNGIEIARAPRLTTYAKTATSGSSGEHHRDARRGRREARRELAPAVGGLELRRHVCAPAAPLFERATRMRAATLNATVTTKRRSPTSASAAMWSSDEATGNSFAMTLDIV